MRKVSIRNVVAMTRRKLHSNDCCTNTPRIKLTKTHDSYIEKSSVRICFLKPYLAGREGGGGGGIRPQRVF